MSVQNPVENPTSSTQEFDPSSPDSVATWYRSLRPDTEISSVPLATHLDAVSSFLLSTAQQDLPPTQQERNAQAFGLLTQQPSETMISALRRSGTRSLTMADLLVELTERDSPIPPKTKWQMLNFGVTAAELIRGDVRASEGERAGANNVLTNLLVARLRAEREIKGGDMPDFEERYRKILLGEAAWLADKKTERAGALFESLIGNVSKQYSLNHGMAEALNVRHGTIREDAPYPGLGKNGGYQFAHDVVAVGTDVDLPPAWIQVKWGPGCEELAARYDQSKITFVAEPCEDDYMDSNADITQALSDISKASGAARVDEIAARYGLDRVLDRSAGQTQKAAGGAAISGV